MNRHEQFQPFEIDRVDEPLKVKIMKSDKKNGHRPNFVIRQMIFDKVTTQTSYLHLFIFVLLLKSDVLRF